jgi:hypothetical protein
LFQLSLEINREKREKRNGRYRTINNAAPLTSASVPLTARMASAREKPARRANMPARGVSKIRRKDDARRDGTELHQIGDFAKVEKAGKDGDT